MTTKTKAAATKPQGSAPHTADKQAPSAPMVTPSLSKLDQLAALLGRTEGASLAELMAATGWQQHSVRGAIAGSLKKRGLVITSDKVDGVRRYRTAASQ